MGATRLEVAEIFRRFGEDYRERYALSYQQRRVMRAIELCRTRMRAPAVKGYIFPMAIMVEIVVRQDTRRERNSDLLDFGSGAGSCLHQTRIRAPPSRSDGATVRRPPRPETILCPRTVLLKRSTRRRSVERCRRSVSCGLGGGADEPSLRSRCLFLKSDSEDPSTVGTRALQGRLDPPWCSKFWVLSDSGTAGRMDKIAYLVLGGMRGGCLLPLLCS